MLKQKKSKKEEVVNKLSEIYLLMFLKTYDVLSKNKLSLKDGNFHLHILCQKLVTKKMN